MATVSTTNLFPQSPYLNLMAAGSDGSDGSAPGIHLRWHLLGTLGDNHLPKGDLTQENLDYNTDIAYNRANDFVNVFRTEYNQAYAAEVRFDQQLNSNDQLKESGSKRQWWFPNLVPIPALPNEKCKMIVTFANKAKYDAVRAANNPLVDPLNFLKQYDDVLEVTIENQVFFALDIVVGSDDPNGEAGTTKVEAIVKQENMPQSPYLIDVRKTFTNGVENVILKEMGDYLLQEDNTNILLEGQSGQGNVNRLVSENMQYVRFRTYNSFPVGLRIETYHHFLKGVNTQAGGAGGWTNLGKFSLSISDGEVMERLEKIGVYDINDRWPKYNGGAKIKTDNYWDRWSNDHGTMPSLRNGIIQYLLASTTDTQAITTIEVNAGGEIGNVPPPTPTTPPLGEWVIGGQKQEIDVALLDMLKTVTTDYHVARMLGLGHIDVIEDASISKKYIHLAVYDTAAPLDDYTGTYSHSYMTLGTSKSDYRLPKAPEIALSYGLFATDLNEESTPLTDEEGYFPNAELRAININVTNHIPVQEASSVLPPFFVPDLDFDNAETLSAIMYGIEYKTSGQTDWRSPEISNDPLYTDTKGKNETVPILWPEENKPLYTHFERESGSHDYGAYSINWFSRASGVSAAQTAVTTFPVIYSLLPPFNFTALLIQPEEPDALFVTTPNEQIRLIDLLGDKTLVRVMFNWDDIQNRNYWHSNKIKFVFRQPMLRSKKGKIKSTELKKIVIGGKNVQVLEVRTESFTRFSVVPAETVSPVLDFGTNEHLAYVQGVFNVEGVPYLVKQILASEIPVEGPIFHLEPVKKRVIVKGEDPNEYRALGVKDQYDIPADKSLFTVFENMASQNNWTTTLEQEINIKIWDQDYSEQVLEEGSNELKEYKVGGITRRVVVSEVNSAHDNQDLTGIYKFEFANNPLTPYDANLSPEDYKVEWYGGVVRVSLDPTVDQSLSGEIRRLDVIGIDTTTVPNKLVLYAIDNQYATQGSGNLDYLPIPKGPNVLVNFHPGYRVYLYAETGFDSSTLYNFGNAEVHDSYIAAYSVDDTKGLSSFVCPPIRLRAEKQHIPLQPEKPSGPDFATKPNFYGKSTYTFETQFKTEGGRKPFSLQFCRGNDMAILQTLYKKDTVEEILTKMATLPALDNIGRLRDLADGKTVGGIFPTYGEGENAYHFPNPNNDDYAVPYSNYIHPVTGQRLPPVYPFAISNYTPVPPNPAKVPDPGTETFVVSDVNIYPYKNADSWKMEEIVKEAILGSFLPLTELPVIYNSIKTSPYEPKNIKPTLRDRSGNLLQLNDPAYDPAPMAVITDEVSNKVRFVDFTLDGASNRLWFYFAREITNGLVLGPVSDVLGPVALVNTSPASPPQIQTVISQPADAFSGTQAGILFEITDYLESERISKFKIYRAFDALSATSTRTMDLATTVSAGDPLADYFDDLGGLVPFGNTLFYRIVAIREVLVPVPTELDPTATVLEDIESLPSNIAVTNLIDVENPSAPEIVPNIDNQTGEVLEGVSLEWEPTAYNATYYLYKMTPSGNWTRIYTVKSNAPQIVYELPEDLPIVGDDDQPIYHRFKVSVENSSGLLNIEENELTIPLSN